MRPSLPNDVSFERETMYQVALCGFFGRLPTVTYDTTRSLSWLYRDLLHPTDGMGITDADARRQILDAVDALER